MFEIEEVPESFEHDLGVRVSDQIESVLDQLLEQSAELVMLKLPARARLRDAVLSLRISGWQLATLLPECVPYLRWPM